eukprot:jgi/Psemu1/57626/gm1.57626_g
MIQPSTFPFARLHKRHNILSFHYVRSMIARGFILMMHIPGKDNCADILTKHWSHSVVYPLLRPIFHFCGNTGDFLQDDGSIIYCVIPFKFDFDQESLENIEFKHTSTTNGVSETQYDKFADILGDYANRNWWNEYVSAPANRTVENFPTTIDAFITYKFNNSTNAYRCHKRFLNNIKKTTNMTVHQFVSTMVTFHNHVILRLLPGHPPTNAAINDEDFKSLIFKSMPTKWKDSYEEHHSPYKDTLTQIVTRMERYQNKENKKSKKNNQQDNSSQNRNTSNNNSNSNRNNKNRHNCNNCNGNNCNKNNQLNGNNSQNQQQGSNNSQGNNNNPSTRVADSSPCPTLFTWGQITLGANAILMPRIQTNLTGTTITTAMMHM